MYAGLPINEIWDGNLRWEDAQVQGYIVSTLHAIWLEDTHGNLYILENDGAAYGPDSEVEEKIAALHEDKPWLDGWGLADELLGLTYVPWVLRRFTTEDGFYHA